MVSMESTAKRVAQMCESGRRWRCNIPEFQGLSDLGEAGEKVSVRCTRQTKSAVLTGSNALPYVHSFELRVPYSALCVHGPVEVELPYARGVADESRHALSMNAAR